RIGDAPLLALAWPVREAARAGKRRGNRTRKAQGQFFELAVVAVVARGLRGGEQRHERGQRRQRRSEEHTAELQSLTNLVCPHAPSPPSIYTRALHDALPISHR